MCARPHDTVRLRSDAIIIAALRDPERLPTVPLSGWGPIIRRARRAGLLGRLATLLADRGILAAVPEPPRRHIEAALTVAEKHRRDVLWEVRCIGQAVEKLHLPLILLKGAAYAVAELPPARGRVFSDIDIMVPREAIRDVERCLVAAGWRPSPVDRWDERFYREWMHQIPPMVHAYRDTLVDVHHTIVPPTARVKLAPSKLLETARPVSGQPGVLTLGPAEMVTHSATHLFNEGEFGRSLRDLVDIDLLLRHFGSEPDFWPSLLSRAQELDLARPMFYALRYAQRILGTPVPAPIVAAAAQGGPGALIRPIMDALFERALSADDLEQPDRDVGIARFMLYIRGHHLRLPPRILLPHLIRKAVLRGASASS
jgi:hypothetical protein